MSERVRKCCPTCGSLDIHSSKKVYGYTCHTCQKHNRSANPLHRCPVCKSYDISAHRVGRYACYRCSSTFEVPASKTVKDYSGPVPAALRPKAEVSV